MATVMFRRFVSLCRYLQDPCHVARFQQLCGVRGTFTRRSEKERERDVSPNGACVKRCDRDRECLKQHDPVNGENKEAPTTAKSRGRVKPLRKNSLTDDVGQEFILESRFLFYLFTMGTELGNEMFFIVFFPFLMWNVDAWVSRQVIVVWVWVLFFGQTTKDLVRWTRPASPPVVKVEVFYNFEYSMPSVHAMTGASVPFCLFLLTYSRWEVMLLPARVPCYPVAVSHNNSSKLDLAWVSLFSSFSSVTLNPCQVKTCCLYTANFLINIESLLRYRLWVSLQKYALAFCWFCHMSVFRKHNKHSGQMHHVPEGL